MPPPLLCQVHMLHMSTRFKKASFSTCFISRSHLMQATWYVSRVPGWRVASVMPRHPSNILTRDIIQNTPARSAQRRSCLSLNPPRRHGGDLHALSDCIFQLVGQSRHIQTCEQCMTMFSSYLLRIFNIQSFKEAMLTLNWDTCLQNLHQWFWSTMIQKTDLPYICPNLRWRRL